MKCDPNDHRIVLAVDGTVFCKNCPQKWSPEQPSTERKKSKADERFDGFIESESIGSSFTDEQPKEKPETKCSLCGPYGCRPEPCGCACHGEDPQPKPKTQILGDPVRPGYNHIPSKPKWYRCIVSCIGRTLCGCDCHGDDPGSSINVFSGPKRIDFDDITPRVQPDITPYKDKQGRTFADMANGVSLCDSSHTPAPQRQEECSCQGEKEACNLCPPNAFEKNIQTLERCLEALSSVAHESLELAKELHKRADDDSQKLSL